MYYLIYYLSIKSYVKKKYFFKIKLYIVRRINTNLLNLMF